MNNENTSRLEQYLQAIADGAGPEALPVPQSRLEEIFLAMATGDGSQCPKPQSRLEAFAYACIGSGGGGGGETDPEEEKSQLAGLIDGSLTELTIPDGVTRIRQNAFAYCQGLVSLKNTEHITTLAKAFNSTKLEEAFFPNVTKIAGSAFYGLTSLKKVNLSSWEQDAADGSAPNQLFSGCNNLEEVDLSSATRLIGSTFGKCYKLAQIDLPKLETLSSSEFNNCYSLTTVILRIDSICKLGNTNTFSGCYHYHGTVDATYNPEGLKDGYIYVPRAWLSDDDETKDYRRATNWTTLADRFRALEDYTVDGTTTGELDESKI